MKYYDLTIEDMQKKFKVVDKTIRNWIKEREMPYQKLGQLIRFNDEEVNEWIKQQTTKHKA